MSILNIKTIDTNSTHAYRMHGTIWARGYTDEKRIAVDYKEKILVIAEINVTDKIKKKFSEICEKKILKVYSNKGIVFYIEEKKLIDL
jgi:hypothetical protein